jgi:hypothetical protein
MSVSPTRLTLRHALLDRTGLVSGLYGAQTDPFGGDLVDGPGRRFRRFGLLGHAGSIGRELCTFNRLTEPQQPASAA